MQSMIEKTRGMAPRRRFAIAGLGLPVVLAIFVGSTVSILSQAGVATGSAGAPWSNPRAWVPEIALLALVLLCALAAPLVAFSVRSAATFHWLRTLEMLLFGACILLPGMRLATTNLSNQATVALLGGIALSLAVQSSKVASIRRQLREARSRGGIRRHLDEGSWTWTGEDSYTVLLDADRRPPRHDGGWVKRLHWFGPAIGILAARYLGGNDILLFLGAVLLVLGIVWAGTLYGELGLALQLGEWDRQRGAPLLLAERSGSR